MTFNQYALRLLGASVWLIFLSPEEAKYVYLHRVPHTTIWLPAFEPLIPLMQTKAAFTASTQEEDEV